MLISDLCRFGVEIYSCLVYVCSAESGAFEQAVSGVPRHGLKGQAKYTRRPLVHKGYSTTIPAEQRIFIELMTSDRKLNASREGSK